MRFFYPAPPASAVEVLKDQAYGALQMDVYRPRNAAGKALPALVFFNIATGAQRSNAFYRSWAEIAASNDFVAILPDLRNESFEPDFDALLAHLAANAASLGVDRERIARLRGVRQRLRALPLVQNPERTAIKAAVMYYGAAQVTAFRRDLPILMVRAGLDRPPVNRAMTELATLASNQNAPVTLLNYPGGHHAFEIVDDEDATRDVIDSTIEFVKRTTAPAFQASLRRGLPEATAAAHVSTGNFAAAASAYAELVKAKPDDARLRLSYGEALLGASQFAAACTRARETEGQGSRPARPRRAGRASVHAEGRRRCRHRVAEEHPAAVPAARPGEGSDLRAASELVPSSRRCFRPAADADHRARATLTRRGSRGLPPGRLGSGAGVVCAGGAGLSV